MTAHGSVRTTVPAVSLVTGLLFFLLQPALAVVIYENDFEDDPVGTYTVANLAADWNGTTSNDGVDEGRVSITDDAKAYGNKSLLVRYPQGESNQGKSQWKLPLGGAYEEMFVSYRLRFDNDFDFVRGGKLPGLSGGADNTGGNKPNGTDGWSARMMWRTNGSGGSPTKGDTANIVQYTYHPDQPTEFGEDMRWDDTKDEYVYYDEFRISTEFITDTLPGDFDGDGDVDGNDLSDWESAHGASEGGDSDGDLDSDGGDFLVWQQNYIGNLSSPLSAVPEPASLLLLVGLTTFSLASRTTVSLVSRGQKRLCLQF